MAPVCECMVSLSRSRKHGYLMCIPTGREITESKTNHCRETTPSRVRRGQVTNQRRCSLGAVHGRKKDRKKKTHLQLAPPFRHRRERSEESTCVSDGRPLAMRSGAYVRDGRPYPCSIWYRYSGNLTYPRFLGLGTFVSTSQLETSCPNRVTSNSWCCHCW